MAVRPIVTYPDPRLRQETVPVLRVTDEIRTLVADLADTMLAEHGAGIAAIQIGAPERIFLIEGAVAGGAIGSPPKVFMNPEILWLSDESDTAEEGCLSFPDIFVQLKRPTRCRVRAMGLDGELFETEGNLLLARAMQHEGDHLNGKLMIDFVGPLKKEMIKRKMKRYAQREAEDS
ncbi:MAG: peptide deformylase [Myxococcales bacterium]|nr:peptide deformylase [Myxococcales bacterium]